MIWNEYDLDRIAIVKEGKHTYDKKKIRLQILFYWYFPGPDNINLRHWLKRGKRSFFAQFYEPMRKTVEVHL